ncbi:hypothetical protein [Actinophytocola sp.]|uniref:hypothetical protein n=1 Tax=Actinophytocola sp. TaxID=1872138 RepID=UPI0025C03803|nr:hypothetical protein [Actinophytocola sp.]
MPCSTNSRAAASRISCAGTSGSSGSSFGIADRDAAYAWAARLDELGVDHSRVIEAHIGWIVSFHDPDGTEIKLDSFAAHGLDQSGRPGYAQQAQRSG